ncbi:MAG: helix-turn-helix domain-containing protein [Opitutaceae bacterium]|nr:helix-turn-helix domain-containing protein [Opitutaceae bacterium]
MKHTMHTTDKISDRKKLPKTYAELCMEHMPRAIMDDADYDNTTEMIDRLLATNPLSKDQESYLETLTQLIEAYDSVHYKQPKATPHELLVAVLESSETTVEAFAKLIGVKVDAAYKIRRGSRKLTVEHIRKIAEKFKLDPAALIG